MNEYLYFQPEYVGKFKCDGAKCNARCCKNWDITVDKETYDKYPREITEHIRFDSDKKTYFITMDKHLACPFLTKKNLCRIQLKHGENFLSSTCATYPRYTRYFGKFFERSLTLTCPVAAKMILFKRKPMRFEFARVPEKIHSGNGKIALSPVLTAEGFAERMLEIQVAMISILQERTLTIDGRLIVLGFFLDKLEELTDGKKVLTQSEADAFADDLTRLVAAYESKKFLAEQVPRMLASVSFDAKKFIGLVLRIFETLYGGSEPRLTAEGRHFTDALVDTLQIVPDENGGVTVSEIAANYERLADEREKFLARYATVLENYLVNELFMNCYPWRYTERITYNYGVFVTAYKIFELILFAATRKGFEGKDDVLKLVDWYATQSDHSNEFNEKIFAHIEATEDILALMESLFRV